MKFLKNNLKVIIAFILGLILAGGIVYAATSAKEVSYTTEKNTDIKNVEEALNQLYSNMKNSSFNFNTVALTPHEVYQKEYDVQNNKYYIFCTLYPTNNITVSGANKLDTNLFIWDYNNHESKVYLGIIKTTSTKIVFSEKVTIALLGTD